MNKLSTERAIEALYTVRAYYASLTAGYPKGKDCKGIGDVMCSEIANSCFMAIKALEQEPCEDCISRKDALLIKYSGGYLHDELLYVQSREVREHIENLPPVTPAREKGEWEVAIGYDPKRSFMCNRCMNMACETTPYCPYCGAEMEVEE